MRGSAFVITDGQLAESNAKTAHGLLRGSTRFTVAGIIDHVHAGKDASEVVPNVEGRTRIYSSLSEALTHCDSTPEILIIGVATKGGVFSDSLRNVALEAIDAGLHVVNGLHDTLGSDPEIVAAATAAGVTLHDIRKPKAFRDLHFWSGSILDVDCPIIAVLGLDCATGKRTTARLLCEALEARGKSADMVYTGQTGWMLGFDHGFIFDCTPNDFVSGELEHAIVSCWNEKKPDVIFLEGQSSLRNPSGPCGSEFLLSAQAKAVVLQHPVGREFVLGFEDLRCALPSVSEEMDLIRMYGSEPIAVTLNSIDASPEEVQRVGEQIFDEHGIPAVNPFEHPEPLIEAVLHYCATYSTKEILS